MEEYISREALIEELKSRDFYPAIVRRAIEAIPAAEVLDVDKAMRFIEDYAFKDEEEVYTNGAVLVPLFRVKQALVDKAYNGFFEGS